MKRTLYIALLLAVVAAGLASTQATGRGRSTVTQTEVTIAVNAPGAQVTIGKETKPAPAVFQLAPGDYPVAIEARGYQSLSTSIRVETTKDNKQAFSFQLQPLKFRLTVNANIKDAEVFINRASRGKAGYAEELLPGTYVITVTAPGHDEYTETVRLDKNIVVTAVLKPSLAKLMLPPKYLEGDFQFLKIYLDGKLVDERQPVKGMIQVPAGRHLVRIATSPAGLAVEGEVDLAPGQTYEIQMLLRLVPPQEKKG